MKASEYTILGLSLNCLFKGHKFREGETFFMGYLRGFSILGRTDTCERCGHTKTVKIDP